MLQIHHCHVQYLFSLLFQYLVFEFQKHLFYSFQNYFVNYPMVLIHFLLHFLQIIQLLH
uniref:Uncharacterized protein n=1 Tax=Arcella intermedia TaxID=1963864 RepID=A0A6B2LW76_9EUKA